MSGGIDVAAILVISLLQLSLRGASSSGHRHPLVIVPGTAASQIYARLTDDYRPSVGDVCGAHRPAGWFRLWKNDRLMREPLLQCFSEQIAIHYDAGLDDYRNTPGVETVARYFGSVEGFRHRNPEDREDSPEMSMLLGRLEAIGYRDGEDLFGAPYDFRYGLAAPGHPFRVGLEFLRNLRDLVEHAATANGGKPVVIVAYSMGGLFVLQLLNGSPPSWRRRFVKHLIAIAVPWGGTVWDIEAFTSGPSVAEPGLSALSTETVIYESEVWLLPSPRVFGRRPLVVTSRRNYSAEDLPQLLADAGFPGAVHPYRSRILPLVGRLEPPGVPVTCILGTGIPTREVLVYGQGFGHASEVVSGDGDGTVNLESLLAAEAMWGGLAAEQRMKVIKVANATHGSILVEDATWREIMKQVSFDDVTSSSAVSS